VSQAATRSSVRSANRRGKLSETKADQTAPGRTAGTVETNDVDFGGTS
jgi:hypothetical protein